MKKIFLVIFAIIFIMLGCTNKDNTKALEKENAELKIKIAKLEKESIGTRLKKIAREKKGRYLAAMGDLKSIGAAVESYMTDNYIAPDDISSKCLTSFYIRRLPAADPWGNKYLYKKVGKENYYIASAGSDGIFEGFDQKGKYINIEGKDIILSNGTYVYCPK
jgi:uncharacterized lipoprotein NlpE involved in copper resistance